MTLQERIDVGFVPQKFKDGNWREATVKELTVDYPFLEKYIIGINGSYYNNRIAIFKKKNETKEYELYMFSNKHQYSIAVNPKSIIGDSSCRYYEPLEDWIRGHDMYDGKCEEETFVNILFDILYDELIPYNLKPFNNHSREEEQKK